MNKALEPLPWALLLSFFFFFVHTPGVSYVCSAPQLADVSSLAVDPKAIRSYRHFLTTRPLYEYLYILAFVPTRLETSSFFYLVSLCQGFPAT